MNNSLVKLGKTTLSRPIFHGVGGDVEEGVEVSAEVGGCGADSGVEQRHKILTVVATLVGGSLRERTFHNRSVQKGGWKLTAFATQPPVGKKDKQLTFQQVALRLVTDGSTGLDELQRIFKPAGAAPAKKAPPKA